MHISQRRLLLWTAAAAALLVLAAPSPAGAVQQLRSAGTATDPFGPVVAALSLLAWVLAGWLLSATLLTALGRLPGLAGCLAAAAARRIAPAVVRRAVEVALGLTVAAGVLGASPAAASPSAPAPAPPAALPSLDWAGSDPARALDLDWPQPGAPASAPTAPPAPPTPTPTPAAPAPPGPASPESAGGPTRAEASTRAGALPSAEQPGTGQPIVVRPGDSLWTLAEQELRDSGVSPTPTQVASAWPRWWAANRELVGDDPDLLLPGTSLSPPEQSPAPGGAPLGGAPPG